MKRLTAILLPILLLSSAFSQNPANPAQVRASEEFIAQVIAGNTSQCWNMFDQEANPDVSQEQFENFIKELNLSLKKGDSDLELYMNGIKMIEEQAIPFYSFKFAKDITKPAPSFLLDIAFLNFQSTKIAGVMPKMNIPEEGQEMASSSAGTETPILGPTVWKIKGKAWDIRGINIVHFKDNEGLISVQVEFPLKEAEDMKEWAQEEGFKFAKHLLKHPAYREGQSMAEELGLDLMDAVGVSFYSSELQKGYNTIIELEDLK